MIRSAFRFTLLLVATLSSAAHAIPLQIAHFAPGTASVDVFIDGERVTESLGYGEVALVDSPVDGIVIEVFDADSATLLHTRSLGLHPQPVLDPMLIIASPADPQRLELMLDQGPGESISDLHLPHYPLPGRISGMRYTTILHLAGRSGGLGAVELELNKTCVAAGPTRPVTFSGRGAISFLAQLLDPTVPGAATSSCDLELASSRHGILTLRNVEERLNDTFNTFRYVLIGDGSNGHPFELLAVHAGNIVARTTATSPEPAPELVSSTFWWDRDRPSHGFTLFEMPGAGIVYGTWSTFDSEGVPVWFILDGVATGLPGYRELQVLAPSADRAIAPLRVGSGHIVYLDCNRAEARIALDDQPLRSLRLQRSATVEQCFALD